MPPKDTIDQDTSMHTRDLSQEHLSQKHPFEEMEKLQKMLMTGSSID
jgi:hypothetical protein